jgi:tRNA(Ile)-lysidine synthase
MRGFPADCGLAAPDEADGVRPLIRRSGARHLLPQGEKGEVERAVHRILDHRLAPSSPRPIAVALSGGGDSVALLLAARAWAEARGRGLLALTVDHGLQPQSAAWTAACGALAARLGAGFRALAWTGPKPVTGLPAAARAARHRLLAQAAREAGANVLLLGHTADDVAEALAMRTAGATTPAPSVWSPSPVWPQGRGLFLLRPLLGLQRAALRTWLTRLGEGWIEDPANSDLRYARARARAAGAIVGELERPAVRPLDLARRLVSLPGGGFAALRDDLITASGGELARLLSLAAVCAGGGSRLPRGCASQRLAMAVAAGGPVAATLAGARVLADDVWVRIVRDAGEAARGGLAPLTLAGGETAAWDGRFEIRAHAPLQVRKLGGLAARLSEDQQRVLAGLPAEVRPALPAVVAPDGAVTCPLLGASPAEAQAITEARLRAAAGLIPREPA